MYQTIIMRRHLYKNIQIGLVSLRRKLKNTLIRSNDKFNYIDLDIKNCIPTICLNIVKKFKNEIDEYINKHIAIFSNEINMPDEDTTDEELKEMKYKLKYLTGAKKTQFKTLEEYVKNRSKLFKNFSNELGCDEALLKTLFNSLTNGGKYKRWREQNKIENVDDDVDEFIKSFEKELLTLGDVISNNNYDFQYSLIKKSNEEDKEFRNINTSTASMYYYTVERILLEHAIEFLINNNIITVDILGKDKYDYENNIYDFIYEYDGIKIPNNINANEITNILNELNNHIFNTTGFNIEFCNKAIAEMIGDKELQKIKKSKLITYEEVKDEFEVLNFKLRSPYCFVELNKRLDDTVIRGKEDFLNVYENMFFQRKETNKKTGETEIKKVNFVKEWLKDENIKTYEKFNFLPATETPPYIFNMFKGYKAEKVNIIKTDIENSNIWFHTKNNICCNDEIRFKYLMNWIANIIQHPLKKTETALIIKGRQGCGKDAFTDFLENIIGEDYVNKSQNNDNFFGNFNDGCKNKLICLVDETSGKDTFSKDENIKSAITRKKVTINGKYEKKLEGINDATHYIFLTNNDNPVKVSYGDRRFVLYEAGEEYTRNKEFFSKLYDEYTNNIYTKAFYNYFKNLDISNFNFDKERPVSISYEHMLETNTPVMALFLEDYLNDIHWDDNVIYKTIDNMFNNYNNFIVKDKYEKSTLSKKMFSIKIKSYTGIEDGKRNGSMRTVDIDRNKLTDYLNNKYKLNIEKPDTTTNK